MTKGKPSVNEKSEILHKLGGMLCPDYIETLSDHTIYTLATGRKLEELQKALQTAEKFLADNPEGIVKNPTGKRPEYDKRNTVAFDKKLATYIQLNTGIEIPNYGFSSRFYQAIAKRLGLWAP